MKHQTPNTKLNLPTYFKHYFVVICLSLFLFGYDNDTFTQAAENAQETVKIEPSIKNLKFRSINRSTIKWVIY